ncbi:MAG: DNA-directed RNA polymerase subunit K [Candidatus Hydrothermarchaeota archaeon]|nr:DNA-directed RNA polymerase subunit K [Candidatus Hydrothermarchaeota archaeon]
MKFTRFEKARIIGARALQLAMGAPPLIANIDDIFDPIITAIRELEKEAIPLTVRRNMPEKKSLGE